MGCHPCKYQHDSMENVLHYIDSVGGMRQFPIQGTNMEKHVVVSADRHCSLCVVRSPLKSQPYPLLVHLSAAVLDVCRDTVGGLQLPRPWRQETLHQGGVNCFQHLFFVFPCECLSCGFAVFPTFGPDLRLRQALHRFRYCDGLNSLRHLP